MKPDIYRKAVALAPVAYSYNRVILNDVSHPADYEILDSNPAFNELTGLASGSTFVGKVSMLLPESPLSRGDWIAFCGQLAMEGNWQQSEKVVRINGVNYRAIIFSPEVKCFVTLLSEISSTGSNAPDSPENFENTQLRVDDPDRFRALFRYQLMKGEKERHEIASSIHSEIGQSMTVMMIELGYLAEHLTGNPRECSEKVSALLELNNGTIKKMQEISGWLRPGVLNDLGLASAIEWYCREWERSTGVNCRLSLAECEVSKGKGLTFFRILQEALQNVKSHSGATVVSIDLSCNEELISMIIHDNGNGIPEEVIRSSGAMGLMSMRERAAMMGGSVRITCNQGCKIEVEIPAG